MIVRPTSGLTRPVLFGCSKVRFASTRAKKPAVAPRPVNPEHGQRIYVYHQFQTNQIVYSLTRSLKNNASLRQLPFNGKKTVPRAIRKDLWAPLALISFPKGSAGAGLSAFQKLREYRKLHEVSWDNSMRFDNDGKTLTRKQRGRKLCDQKANSVADISAVLGMLGTPAGEEIGLKAMETEGEQVEVKWSHIVDAHFARSWSRNVVHDKLEWEKHLQEMSELARQKRLQVRREHQARSQQLKEEKAKLAKAKKLELRMAAEAEIHAKYLADRGITEEQYQQELAEELKAKADGALKQEKA